MSQITLSEKTGINQQHLSNLELGKKEPKLGMVEMLAKGLGIPLRKVFWNL